MQHETRLTAGECPPAARPTRRRLVALALASLAAPVFGGGVAAQSEIRAPWQSQTVPLPTAEILVGDQQLTVEVAADAASRARGLGYRDGLVAGTGMLFVFPEPAPRGFWMMGMRFCIDIIWINDGQILGAAEAACPDPPGTAEEDRGRFRSEEPAQFVLEVPAGWLAEHGFGRGTPVTLPEGLVTGR